jgi:sigma-B regulation protein RsbU (phosphoserine phosphatase)
MAFLRNRSDLIIALLGLTGLLYFIFHFPTLFPSTAIDMRLSKEQVANLAEESMRQWGYDAGQYKLSVSFQSREELIRYAGKHFRSEDANRILRGELPAYYWQATWLKPRKASSAGNGSNSASLPAWIKNVKIRFDQDGREIGFIAEAEEDSAAKTITQEAARAKADSIFRARLAADTSMFKFLRTKQTTLDRRVDYFFVYQRTENIAGLPVNLEIGILGPYAGAFEYQYTLPKETETKLSEYIRALPLLVLISALIIFYIFSFIKKLRADEISFKMALPLTFLSAIAFAYSMVEMVNENAFFESLLSLFFTSTFVGLVLLIAIVTSDALGREAWNEKLLTLDTIRQRRVRYSLFGQSLLRGIAIGFLLRGITSLVLNVAAEFSTLDLAKWSADISDLNVWSPVLYRFSQVFFKSVWYQVVILLFLVSAFSKFFSHRLWIVIITAVFWTFAFGVLSDFPSAPYLVTILNNLVLGAAFAWTFIYFDLLTCLTAYFTFGLSFAALRFISYGYPAMVFDGIILMGFIALLALFGILGLRREIGKEELNQYAPPFVKRVMERERLIRELEIARRVQMSLLPRSNPMIDDLDIASLCIPAMEVGGDYYDFINLGKNKLGVAIGDVSGKGISAAFYMTLTKGFLRSLTRSNLPPGQVLTEINSLFYENVDRGHFISMIYGIFDLEAMTFSFARAGHNPIISRREASGHPELLCPRGLALGLEPGEIFAKVIEERTITLAKDDVFVFYTDGFSEAMNGTQDVFGEGRLEQLISEPTNHSAEKLLREIENQVNAFVGKNAPHDDMTMVIIRVA